MDQYALYLRKSRADVEAEARGEGETLSKHRAALTEYARRRGLFIAREYAEIISGDSIAARPQMQQLLADVKAGMYAGVIVNDVDRLGRGDSIDQEIIKLTFAASHTLIITPARDIDPANPTDDDMLDFSMFMARFEYKKISARMRQGRERSALAGNWVAGAAPFGYRKIRQGRALTLEPDENAPTVRMIFDWYASGEAGYSAIAGRLARMGVHFSPEGGPPPNASCVKRLLQNPVYIGCMRWGRRRQVSVIEHGQRVKRQVAGSPQIVEGVFQAIVSRDTWDAAQARIEQARHRSPINANAHMRNPLSGLIYCSECGRAMVRLQGHGRELLSCPAPNCKTSATYLDVVETALLDTLRGWCAVYARPMSYPAPVEDVTRREALLRQIEQTDAQITRAQELVELGVYAPSEYISRKTALEARRTALTAEVDKLSRPTPGAAIAAMLPQIARVLDAYPLAPTAEAKNALLRSIVSRVIYHKSASARSHRRAPDALLTLDVFPV